jgi:hypothetical protein
MEPAQTFSRATSLSQPPGGPYAPGGSGVAAPSRLLVPPRLIVPASATVKRSLWAFRAPKLELLKD